MLAAINANSLDGYPIETWLSNKYDNDDFNLLHTDLDFDNEKWAINYRIFENDEPSLLEHLECDLWSLQDTYYEFDTLDDEVFPFYIIDTDTKTILDKIGLSFVRTIKTKTID